MAGGGWRPGAGRPKGAKSGTGKGKGAKLAKALTAVVQTAAAGVPVTGMTLPKTAASVAPEGISPKDLLLSIMRMAWKEAHRKAADAKELDDQASRAQDSEAVESFRKLANDVRAEVGKHLAQAQQAAIAVAPYEHARLQSVDATVAGGIIVELKQYPKRDIAAEAKQVLKIPEIPQ